jgi:hypothetical protein
MLSTLFYTLSANCVKFKVFKAVTMKDAAFKNHTAPHPEDGILPANCSRIVPFVTEFVHY